MKEKVQDGRLLDIVLIVVLILDFDNRAKSYIRLCGRFITKKNLRRDSHLCKFPQLLKLASARVFGLVHSAILTTCVEKQRRVALYTLLLAKSIVFIAIHLNDIQLVPHVSGELSPDGCNLLAVATPVNDSLVKYFQTRRKTHQGA